MGRWSWRFFFFWKDTRWVSGRYLGLNWPLVAGKRAPGRPRFRCVGTACCPAAPGRRSIWWRVPGAPPLRSRSQDGASIGREWGGTGRTRWGLPVDCFLHSAPRMLEVQRASSVFTQEQQKSEPTTAVKCTVMFSSNTSDIMSTNNSIRQYRHYKQQCTLKPGEIRCSIMQNKSCGQF